MGRHYIEFANFLCHFGEEKVLMDYLDEIILPAFTDDTLIRERGGDSKTKYHFYEVQPILIRGGRDPIIGIFGQLVKDVTLTRTQVFDPAKGLVEDRSSIPSSPSSYFLLVLNNHQLIYLPKTFYAPSIKEFESTISSFIKLKHAAYLDAIIAATMNSRPRVTKRSLFENIPVPKVNVVPLASPESVASFISRFSVLKAIEFKLHKPNPLVNAKDMFGELRKVVGELGGGSGKFTTGGNSNGLSTTAAKRIVGQAGEAGLDSIILRGKASDGTDLSGSNDDFKVRAPIDTLPGSLESIWQKMWDSFKDTVGHMMASASAEDQAGRGKLRKLADEL